ncbi:hypothetical protein KL936_000322 [Ogataea polymorpha]|nr:hypothetical protein KL936_000322 [Ogataea polymorpha]KAG7921200.1 hypothetical protein KL927_000444 [Ogataea polymorpha]KAG7939165.1 hypothetical protein KL934_000099 [Ogataea polymorpha]
MIAFSTFLEIHMLQNWFDESDPTKAFQHKLRFFMITLCASSIFAFLGCKITDRTEKNEHETEHFSSFNASPLLSGGSAVLGSHSPKAAIATEDLEYVQLDDQMSASSVSYKHKISRFLRDPLMYPLNMAFFMAVGATEFFLTNLSSILSSLDQNTLDYNLQLYSITSTAIRFVIMVATDHVCAKYGISRLSILASLIVMCGLGHVYLSSWPIAGLHINVIVMLNAVLNSGLYTLFPAVLAAVYGFDILGTTTCDECAAELERQGHRSQPIDMIKSSSAREDTLALENDENLCPVCNIDLSDETDAGREQHINNCLHFLEFTGSPDSKRQTNRMLVYTLDANVRVNEDNECVICFEEFHAGDKVGRLECLCCFHYKCIKDWINRKGACECPVHAVAVSV